MQSARGRRHARGTSTLRRLGRIVREAIRSFGIECRRMVDLIRRPGRVRRYLAGSPPRKLNIGCGPNPAAGWLNTDIAPCRADIEYLDARDPFPLPNASVDYVYVEHMLQELRYTEMAPFLSEVARVLAPGGCVRISAPDLKRIVSVYGAEPGTMADRYLDWSVSQHFDGADAKLPGFAVNCIFEQCAGFVPDQDTLRHLLERAGFVEILQQSAGISEDPSLNGLERHGRLLGDEEINAFESVVFEARKPARDA